jgi:surface polysaccharide O-acyltransferase-like enzyme
MKKESSETERIEKKYELWADVVRTIAILGVVAIHTVNTVYERPDFFGGMTWWITIIINSLSRICIPFFIMISGYFLLKKDHRFIDIVKKIVNRLAIPLVFWTIMVFIFGNPQSASQIFDPNFYLRFLAGNVYYFYFLIILIGLYSVSPLLRIYIKNTSLKSQEYMALGFLSVGIIETIEEYLTHSCAVENSFTKWVPYTGLFVLGYLIGSNKTKFKKTPVIMLFYSIGVLTTIGLNYIFYSYKSVRMIDQLYPGCLSHYADYYLSINVVLMAISGFIVLSKINYGKIIKSSFVKNIIYQIARASFGIYLTHLWIVDLWDHQLGWTVDAVKTPLYVYAIGKWILVFLSSYVVSYILGKTPGIKRLIGSE